MAEFSKHDKAFEISEKAAPKAEDMVNQLQQEIQPALGGLSVARRFRHLCYDKSKMLKLTKFVKSCRLSRRWGWLMSDVFQQCIQIAEEKFQPGDGTPHEQVQALGFILYQAFTISLDRDWFENILPQFWFEKLVTFFFRFVIFWFGKLFGIRNVFPLPIKNKEQYQTMKQKTPKQNKNIGQQSDNHCSTIDRTVGSTPERW